MLAVCLQRRRRAEAFARAPSLLPTVHFTKFGDTMKIPFFSATSKGFKDITSADLKALPPGTRLIDVREPGEYASDHLDSAELVPLATLSAVARAWDPTKPLVLICRSGNRSSRGAQELVALGFQNIMNLSGGMMAVRGG
jgi:rhodanese-related sulfurtransferase